MAPRDDRIDIRIEPIEHRLETRLSEVAFEQTPHAWLELRVMRLAIALPQPREDAEDACIPLGGQRPIGALERFPVAGRSNVAIEHRPLDLRRHVAPRVLQYRSKVVGRVACKSVLEVEQAEMADALATLHEHHIFRVIVAEHGHRSQPIIRNRPQNLRPGGLVRIGIHRQSNRRAIPIGEKLKLFEPLAEPMGRQARHWLVLVKMDENVGRQFVELALPRRIAVEKLAKAPIAEVAKQEETAVNIARENFRSRKTRLDKPLRDGNKWPHILMLRGASISTAKRSPWTTRK